MKSDGLDDAFLTYACGILADTNSGLSGNKIVEFCSAYALDFGRVIPQSSYPFNPRTLNKRSAMKQNLNEFSSAEQFQIIKELSDLDIFRGNEDIKQLRIKMFSRYGNLAAEKISDSELIQKTKHWLEDYPSSLKQYENALSKYEGGIFERNTLDDMRLAFELLIKDLLGNNKSLENQIADIGSMLKKSGASSEIRNMVTQIIKYYTDFQNNHVKHNDAVNGDELEYVIELTSVIMKFLIKANGGN
jgi:hypothetical protein